MLHCNHCNHPHDDFIMSVNNCDIYRYMSDLDNTERFCVRYSSEPSNYEGYASLDAAIERANNGRS